MTVVAAVVIGVPILLTVLHHLAYTWPGLAYRDEISRPLRIDRTDSFAAWWLTMVLLVSAGATRLIYVLRRHRRDDYRGHYQLWQLTLVVLLLACVHSVVDLVAWMGALLELAVGDRAVLSGANWFRIVLDVGGIILAMRLIAELYRCRPALIAMMCAGTLLGISEAAAWQVFAVDSMIKATTVLAAPMLAWSCFLIGSTIYLRSMYRQVRNIPDAPSLRERFAQWMDERRNDDADFEPEFFQATEPRPRAAAITATRNPVESDDRSNPRSDARRRDRSKQAEKNSNDTRERRGLFSKLKRGRNDTGADQSKTDSKESTAQEESTAREESTDERPKRRWFGLRAAKQVEVDEPAETPADTEPIETPQKKRRFSLRLRPQSTDQQSDDEADENETPDETAPKEKKGWFGGLMGRKKSAPEQGDGDDQDDEKADRHAGSASGRSGPLAGRGKGPLSSAARQQPSRPESSRSDQTGGNDDLPDPDDIDWNSMSKAERRRMRKKLKRSGRAA